MKVNARSDFNTGNGLIELADEYCLLLDRDMRDSAGDRWYWHIQACSTADTMIQVKMARPKLLGKFGPALNRGGAYEWLSTERSSHNYFNLFLENGSSVKLCATIPYGLSELASFRTHASIGTGLCWRSLATSEDGRIIPLLSSSNAPSKSIILLTARHHACEAMASYVLEGAICEFVRLCDTGESTALQSKLIALPMVDVDGVCRGDQGKGRIPWDHGRDYSSESRYMSVTALRTLLLNERRPLYSLDLHTPGLRGSLEEKPYFVASGDEGDLNRAEEMLSAFFSFNSYKYFKPEILVFDEDWNSASSQSQRCCCAWLRTRESTRLALAVEFPNAVLDDRPVLPDHARQFGRIALRSLIEVMR